MNDKTIHNHGRRSASLWLLVTGLLVSAGWLAAVSNASSIETDHDHDEHGIPHHDGERHGEDRHDGADHRHGDHEAGHEAHPSTSKVSLSRAQVELAGIVSRVIRPRPVAETIQAPGEIRLNAYRTGSVTPRVAAQVVERFARLGDEVVRGQRLLMLSSVEMARAQGELFVAEREWQRVKKLGRKVVSAARYTEARVAREQARARVMAYGMSRRQVDDFLAKDDASKADGRFELLSPQDGTVIRDRFVVGELIEPGRELFVISDESMLWVEARLTPQQARRVAPGNRASIRVDGREHSGTVIQVHHALDENTRTLGVRIEIANPDDALHPGIFVDASIATTEASPVMAVPVTALLRSPDGDWMVFVESQPGHYAVREVELIRRTGGLRVIDGLAEGSRVVVEGAFFIQSELAKSGFEVHNH